LVIRNFQTAGLLAVIGAVISLVGCTGAIESASSGSRDGDGPGRPNPNAGGSGPSNDSRATDETLWSADPATCAVDSNPGWVGLRRLTRLEYDNTVRDLLGDTTSPA